MRISPRAIFGTTLLLLCFGVLLEAQGFDSRDFTVLLDLGPVLEESRTQIVGVFLDVILKDYLNSRQLDEFHLVGVGSSPRLLFRERVFTRERTDQLLIGLNQISATTEPGDLPAALEFTRSYLLSLGNSKAKQILLIMGEEPLEGERTLAWKRAVENFSDFCQLSGWRFRVVLIPKRDRPTAQPSAVWEKVAPVVVDGSEDLLHRILGSPRIKWPSHLTARGESLELPLTFTNFESEQLMLILQEVMVDGHSAYRFRQVIPLAPKSTQSVTLSLTLDRSLVETPGTFDRTVQLIFEDRLRAFPASQILPLEVQPAPPLPSLFVLAILLLVGLVFLFLVAVLIARRIQRVPRGRRSQPLVTRAAVSGTPNRGYAPPRALPQPSASTALPALGQTVSAKMPSSQSPAAAGSQTAATRSDELEEAIPLERRPAFWESLAQLTEKEKASRQWVDLAYEVWTDDYLYQNNTGRYRKIRFHEGEKKVLGAATGVPVRIMHVPPLGELYWDGGKLWFQPWVQGFSTGNEPVDILLREVVWERPGKRGLHFLFQPYLSEAEKFRRFLAGLGKTTPSL